MIKLLTAGLNFGCIKNLFAWAEELFSPGKINLPLYDAGSSLFNTEWVSKFSGRENCEPARLMSGKFILELR